MSTNTTPLLNQNFDAHNHWTYVLFENNFSGEIMKFDVVDGGLVCSTEEVAEKNDDCYIVNAAVYVGY